MPNPTSAASHHPSARAGSHDDPRDRGGDRQPLLIVNGLHKYFPIRGGLFNRIVGHVHAVENLSFVVMKGETLGIVGESGCGKSTLARLLMQLLKRDSGELIFDGDAVGERSGISLRELRQNMQMVFQDSSSSLNPRLPVVDTIAYGPRVHGTKRTDAKEAARKLLDDVGLRADQFAARYPHELSGGQKQRVNIARALALDPRLLILDEAVSALDKSVEAQVLKLLRELKHHFGLTYVFISHDLHVVRYVSDRVLVMYLGEIVEIGPADEVYGNPKHPYTRALLDSQLSMDPGQRVTEAPLAGDPPNPVDPPAGCRFRTRCPFAESVCERISPTLGDARGRQAHAAACHMHDPASGHGRTGNPPLGTPQETRLL
ncbi:ABC transporter ATP-binding protein [Caballeronia sp. dw_19]|uniref:ABC transporter ATP-binding protein n=1 Tax=Caballeronia sp. dw_19 TaxID=2719791 RepID=UPI001BD52D9E|nr:ABC transporter ATP-binding protein [Caballeronia sp. dw_19]